MNVAVLGFGTVGSETVRYLLEKRRILKSRSSHEPVLKAVYSRTAQKMRSAGIKDALIVDDWKTIVSDPKIDCIIELMGGIDIPLHVVTQALHNKKHVITANKALLAHHGEQLLQLAAKNEVCICFEASCGGGVPIIRALTDGLISNDIYAVYGVLNGTCNFILTEMEHKNVLFENALADAQTKGLAEADPTLDVDGFDSGHKIAIMSTLSFNSTIDIHAVPITGITNVKNADISFCRQLGYSIKLIAAAIASEKEICVWVHPALLDHVHPMANIEGPFNAISVLSSEVGHTLYYGRGAGGKATNSAIISDVISIANGSAQQTAENLRIRHIEGKRKMQTGIEQLSTEAYIRFTVLDKPGVLADITHIFKEYGISVARLLQEDAPHTHASLPPEIGRVALIIITHPALWKHITAACEKIARIEHIDTTFVMYPIISSLYKMNSE